MTHTPGPWALDGGNIVDARGGFHFVKLRSPWIESAWDDDDEAFANTRLMAAAPELLSALVDLDEAFVSRHGCFPLDTVTEEQRQWNRAMKNARAAIAKALGK